MAPTSSPRTPPSPCRAVTTARSGSAPRASTAATRTTRTSARTITTPSTDLSGACERSRQVTAVPDADGGQAEPARHACELGSERGGDTRLAHAGLRVGGLHAQRARGAVGLEIDARDERITEQEREHVVAVHA